MVLSPWTCVCGERNAGPNPCPRCLTPAPTWVHAEPTAALTPEPRRHRLILPLAVFIAVLLVAGALAVGAVAGDDDEAVGMTDDREVAAAGGETIRVTPDGADTDGLDGVELEIAQAIPALMRFVQEERGLPFKEPVEVTLLPDGAFRQRLRSTEEEQTAEEKERVETNERVLRALGLLEGDVDLTEAMESLLGSAVAGFYDTEEDDLVVRGDRLSASVKVTFVHELTHALQDQHFDLDREDIEDRDDEASQAFTSVIEGDAVRIEQLYLDTLSASEQKAAQDEEMEAASGIDPNIPRILLESIAFPYAVGPGFASEVVAAGGQAKLDDAFRTPPTTSEQIIHPDLYVADGEPPRTVADPEPDGDEIDAGAVGEFGLILILQRILDDRTAIVAANGWGGDRYVAWDDDDKTCVRTNLVMDTAKDAREMADALREAAEERDQLEVTVTPRLITFTSCG